MIHRALAAAVVTTLMASPAFADEGDRERAEVLSDTQVRCYDLQSQFDNAVSGMQSTPEVQAAKAMRVKGENQCDAEEDIDAVKQGAETLEQALAAIGQTPGPAGSTR